MFFKKLFDITDTILIGELKLSNESSFKILSQTELITDKELILLGLLVYARVLKIEISKKEREVLLEIFNKFYILFRKSNNQTESIKIMLNTLEISSKSPLPLSQCH